MFFYILCLYCSNDGNQGALFEGCTITGRKIKLDLKGYSFSDVSKAYFHQENNAPQEEITLFIVDNDSISFKVPTNVTNTFSITISNERSMIINVGKFKFDPQNAIKKVDPLKIHRRFFSTTGELKSLIEAFKKDEEQKKFSFDNYPVVRYSIEDNNLFLDLDKFCEQKGDLEEVILHKIDESIQDKTLLKDQDYELGKCTTTEFLPKINIDSESDFVLGIENTSIKDFDDFSIKIKIKGKTYFFGGFIKKYKDTNKSEYELKNLLSKVSIISEEDESKDTFVKEILELIRKEEEEIREKEKKERMKKEKEEKEKEKKEIREKKEKEGIYKKKQRFKRYFVHSKSTNSTNESPKADTPKVDTPKIVETEKSSKEVPKAIPSKEKNSEILSTLGLICLVLAILVLTGFFTIKYLF